MSALTLTPEPVERQRDRRPRRHGQRRRKRQPQRHRGRVHRGRRHPDIHEPQQRPRRRSASRPRSRARALGRHPHRVRHRHGLRRQLRQRTTDQPGRRQRPARSTSNVAANPPANNGSYRPEQQQPVGPGHARPSTDAAAATIAAGEGFIDTVGRSNGTGFPFAATDGVFNTATENGLRGHPADHDQPALRSGNHTIYVHGKDAAGNWGATASLTYLIDRTRPDLHRHHPGAEPDPRRGDHHPDGERRERSRSSAASPAACRRRVLDRHRGTGAGRRHALHRARPRPSRRPRSTTGHPHRRRPRPRRRRQLEHDDQHRDDPRRPGRHLLERLRDRRPAVGLDAAASTNSHDPPQRDRRAPPWSAPAACRRRATTPTTSSTTSGPPRNPATADLRRPVLLPAQRQHVDRQGHPGGGHHEHASAPQLFHVRYRLNGTTPQVQIQVGRDRQRDLDQHPRRHVEQRHRGRLAVRHGTPPAVRQRHALADAHRGQHRLRRSPSASAR